MTASHSLGSRFEISTVTERPGSTHLDRFSAFMS